jgi:hypothetical protein
MRLEPGIVAEIAAAFLRVLGSLGIDAEVFETPPPFRPK